MICRDVSMKKTLLFIIIGIILSCCGKTSVEKITENTKLEWQVNDYDWAMAATLNSASIYDDNIVLILRDKNEYLITFYSIEGKLVKTVPFTSGKGPGEVIYPYAFCIQDNIIYTYDNRLQKIVKMDINGECIEDYMLNKFMGLFPEIVVHDDSLFLSSVYGDNLITRFDKSMNVINTIPNDLPLKDMKKGDKATNGTIAIDHERKEIYHSNRVLPYKITKYDMDFNIIGELTSDLVYGYKNYSFTGRNFEGDMVVSNMIINNNYIYTSVCAREKAPNKPFFINIFDLKKNKLKYHIICPDLTEVADDMLVRVIGVKNNKIYLLVILYNYEKEQTEMFVKSVNNPVKE